MASAEPEPLPPNQSQQFEEPKQTTDTSPPAASIDDGVNQKGKTLPFYLGFCGLCLISFIYSLDATTLAVAIPSIAEDLNGTTLQSFWANISYLLAVVVTQPLYTTISDVFGRKPPLYVGFVFFAVGSVVFALARNMPTVIAGRVLQGLGGGGLDVLAEIVVADLTTLQERPLYLGLLAIPTAIGSILGPTMGAVWSSFVTWRWIGWVNLPILAVSFVLVFFFLRLRPIGTSFFADMKRLDWGGIALIVAGTTIFILPLSWAGSIYPWKSWQTLLPLFLGAALLIAFGFYESLPKTPVFPLKLFHSRVARLTLLGNFVFGAMLFVVLQYLPLLYQAAELETVIGSAVTLLPTSILSVVSAVCGVVLVGVVGRGYRWAIRLFWVLLTLGVGILGLLKLDFDTSKSMRMGLPVLYGVGVGALMRLLHLPIQASVLDVNDTGLAIGLLLSFRLMGGLVGLAVGSTIFNSVFASSISTIGELPDSLAILRNANEAIGFIPKLRTLDIPRSILDPVLEAYLTAMRAIFYTMAGFGGVGLVTSLFTKDISLQRSELGRQRFE
ncbi:major facilitator superfamily domain-containing protein [Hypoxylon trugodes]|uniref:major facilitator superfamily domain-containing protein n=1 Tax=Hypoxylon trugodes TaxID=326681 RepID=UPI00219F95B6|nr:major facilitator superfamily domain-containing protein [Hypoxylon trugodes]KAI1388529.1 major facilitator superfamily domain-containing protein [Hypoxylon trugodes]